VDSGSIPVACAPPGVEVTRIIGIGQVTSAEVVDVVCPAATRSIRLPTS